MQWRFPIRDFNDVEQEVTEVDQFNTDKVRFSEALVREATQNSQDARLPDSPDPVRLRFRHVTEADGLDGQFLTHILHGLTSHIDSSGIEVDRDRTETPAVLLVEDFGTEGLTGSTNSDADQGNFRSFWFRHGGSFKKGTKNGRWGLGKLTFPMSSALRCFFGLTIRKDDPTPLLLGQAVLKTHYIDGVKHAPHGHFGQFQENRLHPIDDPVFLAEFTKELGLTRTTESGLSVVIPYPVEAPDAGELIGFVVKNYAYPILTGRLNVDVMGRNIDARTIREIGQEYLEPGFLEFIETIHGETTEMIDLPEFPFTGNTCEFDKQLIGEQAIARWRDEYATGKLLGFNVPVSFSRKSAPKGAPKELRSFKVFLRSAPEEDSGSAVFVRGDITVPEAAARMEDKGVFCALLAHDPLVSEFLADAENPAHTNWSGRAARLRENWKYPHQTLQYIQNMPVNLFRALTTGNEYEDPNALINFFWIDDPEAKKKGTGDGSTGGGRKLKPATEGVIVPRSKQRIIISRLNGGFEIRPGSDFSEIELPARLKVEVAYDVEYGNAIKEWSPLDFDLASPESIAIENEGAEIEAEKQVIEMEIVEPEFLLRITGFDANRDIVVQANWLKGRSSDA